MCKYKKKNEDPYGEREREREREEDFLKEEEKYLWKSESKTHI